MNEIIPSIDESNSIQPDWNPITTSYAITPSAKGLNNARLST